MLVKLEGRAHASTSPDIFALRPRAKFQIVRFLQLKTSPLDAG